MDAQPDFQGLSQAFVDSANANAAASREIVLLANIPAINNGQRLFEVVQRLATSVDNLTNTVNTLVTDVNTLRAEVNTLRADVNTLRADVNTRFDSLELRLSAESVYYFSLTSLIE